MSEKKYDNYGRFRSLTISFRVSPEENRQIDTIVALSGMTKQDYIISKVLDRNITVRGNCKIHRAVYDKLSEVLSELQKIEGVQAISQELSEDIHLIAQLVDRLYMPQTENS